MEKVAQEYEPIVNAFDPTRVRAVDIRAKIARAISEATRDCALSRKSIAESMSEFIGEEVTLNMLNAYASEAREDTIPVLRLVGLIHATGDLRLLHMVAEMFGHSVIEDKWLSWVDVGRLTVTKVGIDKKLDAAILAAQSEAK